MKLAEIIQKGTMTKTVFVPNAFPKKGEHILTVMQKNEFSKYECIGKIYEVRDRLSGKPKCIARDYKGNRIFKPATELFHIKDLFKERGEELVKISQYVNRSMELQDIRSRKTIDKNIQR